jgi:hypothetical protein
MMLEIQVLAWEKHKIVARELTQMSMLTVNITLREQPFNLKGMGGGGGGGGYGFFSKKKYSDSQCFLKKYSDFGGGKKI